MWHNGLLKKCIKEPEHKCLLQTFQITLLFTLYYYSPFILGIWLLAMIAWIYYNHLILNNLIHIEPPYIEPPYIELLYTYWTTLYWTTLYTLNHLILNYLIHIEPPYIELPYTHWTTLYILNYLILNHLIHSIMYMNSIWNSFILEQ